MVWNYSHQKQTSLALQSSWTNTVDIPLFVSNTFFFFDIASFLFLCFQWLFWFQYWFYLLMFDSIFVNFSFPFLFQLHFLGGELIMISWFSLYLIWRFLRKAVSYFGMNLLLQYSPHNQTLRVKCPYLEIFWSIFSHIWTEYGEIFHIVLYSVRMRENADQNNS